MENKVHLFLLIVLSIGFVTLLLLSNSQKNVSIEYSYAKEITVKSTGNEIIIGNVTLTNNGFLPKKAKLDSKVLCFFDTQAPRTFTINFAGDVNYNYGEPFFSTTYSRNVDLSSNENKKIVMTTWVDVYSIAQDTKAIKPATTGPVFGTYTAYLFDIKDSKNEWNYCQTANTKDAIETISLKFINATTKYLD
jgi:hypothetical protein